MLRMVALARTIVVAYDGTEPSRRALDAAADLADTDRR
jgi:nucleotide-binding universal stress UspA family protein